MVPSPGFDAVRLVVFGDSWASDTDCWPEVLAARLKWRAENFAVPYAASTALHVQLRRLCTELAAGEYVLDAECLAVVHVGGNDLFHSNPAALAAVALAGPCCGALLPTVVRKISQNVKALVEGLMEVGVRRVVLAGVPLSASMPFIAAPAAARAGAVGTYATRAVMRGCNLVVLAGLRRSLVDAQRGTGAGGEGGGGARRGPHMLRLAVCLDEAAAIDAASMRGINGGNGLWEDESHPTPALHAALATAFAAQLELALERRREAEVEDMDVVARAVRRREPAPETDDERAAMLAFKPTPEERHVMYR
jgi:hypothetical protein